MIPASRTFYHGTPDATGTTTRINFHPDGLDITRNITTQFLSDLMAEIPEMNDNRGNVVLDLGAEPPAITSTANIYVTFLGANCSRSSALGAFTYPTSSAPSTIDDITDFVILFPLLRSVNDGGPLTPGDTVMMPGSRSWQGDYHGITTTSPLNIGGYNHQPGRSIGFFLISNGWTGDRVDLSHQAIFSIPGLNGSGATYQAGLSGFEIEPNSIIICFEDTVVPETDGDFNDAVISVSVVQ